MLLGGIVEGERHLDSIALTCCASKDDYRLYRGAGIKSLHEPKCGGTYVTHVSRLRLNRYGQHQTVLRAA
jgi:hypothetical protein